MLSALRKLAKAGDDRGSGAPAPMSSSLQKKFSKGVHYNMKILIKGDRNVGKSCLLQRLQGGPFIEEYRPTDQIQAAAIHWTYKSTDHIVKVEVWEVVDKGRAKKKVPLGLKLENQSTNANLEAYEAPALDATFLDVYKDANGVILMMDITKPWTYDYVQKELALIPADLPVVVLGNHCDMQHHRQVHKHHIDQMLFAAKQKRSAPIRYAESSMRNGFGLRLLHKFLNVPFLTLQRSTLLEQLARNQRDADLANDELDQFQCSEEANYTLFLERLATKRRQDTGASAGPVHLAHEKSPSIVLGAGKPIVPPNVNPLVSASLNSPSLQFYPTEYVSASLGGNQLDNVPNSGDRNDNNASSTPVRSTQKMQVVPNDLEDFCPGALDNSFLDDFSPASNIDNRRSLDTDSETETNINPMVMNTEDDVDSSDDHGFHHTSVNRMYRNDTPPLINRPPITSFSDEKSVSKNRKNRSVTDTTSKNVVDCTSENYPSMEPLSFGEITLSGTKEEDLNRSSDERDSLRLEQDMDRSLVMWPSDNSVRRSPEGGEDPEAIQKKEKTHKKPKEERKHKKSKKSKEKDRDRHKEDKTERKKNRESRKNHSEKTSDNALEEFLSGTPDDKPVNYEEYDSI